MSSNKKIQLDKPLTLEMLIKYNRKVLFPEMEERLVTKGEFNNSKTYAFDVILSSTLRSGDLVAQTRREGSSRRISSRSFTVVQDDNAETRKS
ncbi:MAG: hypothetical protein ACD_58C00168G0003 [uncultured bacterium]|nr:MAG: hypothetical protein ACD_58C00168G0003 [uncultured bacterium]